MFCIGWVNQPSITASGQEHFCQWPKREAGNANSELLTMKNKIALFIGALCAGILITTGCSSTRVENNTPSTQTEVSLSRGNYKMIQPGAMGSSYGFRFFLGIIPITAPSTAAARADLYRSVGQSLEGRSVALINVTEDRSTTWLLLFSIPKVVITGDVVEFNQENPTQPVQQATGGSY
jgi:hypothetical protein